MLSSGIFAQGQQLKIRNDRAATFGAYSPDGTKYVVTSYDHDFAYIIDIPFTTPDGYFEIMEDRADAMEGITPLTHPKNVQGADFSHDGRWLATACQDGNARIFDLLLPNIADQEPLLLVGHTGFVWGAAWSPDDTMLATTGEDGTVRLWSEPWDESLVMEGHSDTVVGVSWTPDGSRLASASWDGTVRVVTIISSLEQLVEGVQALHVDSDPGEVTTRDVASLSMPDTILNAGALFEVLHQGDDGVHDQAES